MNVIREINRINERELALGGDGTKASWHDDYKDSAYVFVGGLPFELTEGDVITIMSQFGEVADINMPRDKETGKTKGFAFLMYEDQRSTVLAVDNLTGAKVLGRTLRVDHVKDYKQPGSRNEEGEFQEPEAPSMNALPPMINGSDGSSSSSSGGEEDEDPMAAYIRAERKKAKGKKKSSKKIKGEREESKEERRARKAAKRAKRAAKDVKKEGSVKREREDSPRRERSRPRERYRSGSRDRSPTRHRSPSRNVKYEPEEDVKPSLSELRRGGEDAAGRRRDERRRSETPPFVGRVKHEASPPGREGRRDDYPDRRNDRRDYPDRRDDRRNYDSRPSDGDRHDSRSHRNDYPSRRTETDWRAARHETGSGDPYRDGGRGDRPGEGDYATWKGRRDVERVMRRVGGRDGAERRRD
ncbi:RNA-binding protein Cwf29 [Naganishia albida]|nr:RNA-binding protein Cwf29 [Naganishia albida]